MPIPRIFASALIILWTCAYKTSTAQVYPRINLDLNFLRYAPEKGLDKNESMSRPLHVFSAVKLGAALTKQDVIHAGLRRLPDDYSGKNSTIELEKIAMKGFEATIGYERNLSVMPLLSFLPEIGFFYDHANMVGSLYENGGKAYVVNHRRNYTGLYGEFKVGVHISRHFTCLAATRIRYGQLNTQSKYKTQPWEQLYAPEQGYSSLYDPLSSLSVRYQF